MCKYVAFECSFLVWAVWTIWTSIWSLSSMSSYMPFQSGSCGCTVWTMRTWVRFFPSVSTHMIPVVGGNGWTVGAEWTVISPAQADAISGGPAHGCAVTLTLQAHLQGMPISLIMVKLDKDRSALNKNSFNNLSIQKHSKPLAKVMYANVCCNYDIYISNLFSKIPDLNTNNIKFWFLTKAFPPLNIFIEYMSMNLSQESHRQSRINLLFLYSITTFLFKVALQHIMSGNSFYFFMRKEDLRWEMGQNWW